MREMAEIGRGQSRFIRSHEDVGEVMNDFFRTLESPVLLAPSLVWLDRNEQVVDNIICYPNPCPDVYYDRPLQTVAKFPKDFQGFVRIQGDLKGEKIVFQCPVAFNKDECHPAISKLYGRAKINDLLYGIIFSESAYKEEEFKEKIILTTLEHQLVSPFTSRVAVEVKDSNGALVMVKVPVPIPRGWNYPATATNHVQLFVGGAMLIFLALVLRLVKKK